MSDNKRGLFDHIKQIKKHKKDGYWESLTKEEKKAWSAWMVHRFISMEPDYLPIVNQVQHLSLDLDDRLCYTLWKDLLPRDPRYAKYIKADKSDKDTVPDIVIDRVAEYHVCSHKEAREYLHVFTESDERLEALRDIACAFATEPAERKKIDRFVDRKKSDA